MRRVVQIMGMPVSVDVPAARTGEVFERVFALLRDIDARFSTYKPGSEVSLLQAGTLGEQDMSGQLRRVLADCTHFEKLTSGAFSARFAGRLDPTGYVKGWAIAQAGKLLEESGFGTYLINIAGDMLARSDGPKIWRVALQHPLEQDAAFGMLAFRNGAVATSGTYARGPHIIDPHTGRPAKTWLTVTVTGPDIAAADVFATAVCAMGEAGPAFIEAQPGYEALFVRPALEAVLTSGFAASMQTVQSQSPSLAIPAG